MVGRDHREKYYHRRPHSSSADLTPVEFAKRRLAKLRPFDSVEAACAPQDTVNKPNHRHNFSQQVAQTSGARHLPSSAHCKDQCLSKQNSIFWKQVVQNRMPCVHPRLWSCLDGSFTRHSFPMPSHCKRGLALEQTFLSAASLAQDWRSVPAWGAGQHVT